MLHIKNKCSNFALRNIITNLNFTIMENNYHWYKVVSPKGATTINAFMDEDACYLKSIGYDLTEVSVSFAINNAQKK